MRGACRWEVVGFSSWFKDAEERNGRSCEKRGVVEISRHSEKVNTYVKFQMKGSNNVLSLPHPSPP
jgi:hypothetical protein